MAKLHRFVKLNDRFDSQIFTFLLPQKLTSDDSPETYTKDFTYGYHKWTAYFNREAKHIGCFLKLQSSCNGMKVQIDFSYTVLNKEHFTKNECYIEKACVFTPEANQHGRKTFIGLSDLLERGFTQISGDYLVELEMRKISCTFECYIRLPREVPSRYQYETKLESPYFSYGLFDWSMSLIPNESTMQQDETVALQLHRHTSFDHICNVRYYVSLGENNAYQSEELDQLVDVAGNGDIFIVLGSIQSLARGRSALKMRINMTSVVSVSEVTLNVANIDAPSRAHLYDKDKQAWLMEVDTSGKFLSLRLYYTDITHVPRTFSRYVCWNVLILTRYIPEHKIKTNYGPFGRYYVQQDLDEGHLITTRIPVSELLDENCLFTEPDDPRITVHIEWVDSHLLTTPTYHALDDTDKLQKHQMKREILALQSENLVLEKQMHSYQMALSKPGDRDVMNPLAAQQQVDKGPPSVGKTVVKDAAYQTVVSSTTATMATTAKYGGNEQQMITVSKNAVASEKNTNSQKSKRDKYGDKEKTSLPKTNTRESSRGETIYQPAVLSKYGDVVDSGVINTGKSSSVSKYGEVVDSGLVNKSQSLGRYGEVMDGGLVNKSQSVSKYGEIIDRENSPVVRGSTERDYTYQTTVSNKYNERDRGEYDLGMTTMVSQQSNHVTERYKSSSRDSPRSPSMSSERSVKSDKSESRKGSRDDSAYGSGGFERSAGRNESRRNSSREGRESSRNYDRNSDRNYDRNSDRSYDRNNDRNNYERNGYDKNYDRSSADRMSYRYR